MILPSLHQPWLNVCLRHSSTALAVEFIVGVDPFAVVYASFNPASSSRRRILPPATRPNPRGAGRISTTTLPPLPRTLNGTECFWEHLHSQLPHPSLIGLTLMYAWVDAKMAKSYLVVRIRGQVDVPHWATTTMELLRLDKKYRATILQTQINTLGMLDKVKHYVSWQEADLEITKELLDKRGRKSGYRKIESEDLKEMGFAGIDEMASSIAEGKVSMSKIKTLKPWFALAPPRQGFKRSTKRLYTQKGILGPNKELIELVRKMI